MRIRINLLLCFLLIDTLTCIAKESKYILLEATPDKQSEYINNLLIEAKLRMSNHDYTSAQSLLSERCELLDLYYEKNGVGTAEEGNTGYEYMVFVPKLYCNLRIGQVKNNMGEITHLRNQYQKLFGKKHPQDDLLETEIAETYYRMGNIGMAIETGEKLLDRLYNEFLNKSVAYHKMYHRLMAYYKSIGRTDTKFFKTIYKPKENIDATTLYGKYAFSGAPFKQKITYLIERAAKLTSEGEENEARNVLKLGLILLDEEFPSTNRSADSELNQEYNLLNVQLLSMLAKTYYEIYFPDRDAENCLLSDYESRRKVFGEKSTELADAAQALADYYFTLEDRYEDAVQLYHEAYDIVMSSSENRKGQSVEILGAMMDCYSYLNKPKAVANYAKELIKSMKDLIISSFKVGSSAERAALWDKYNHWLLLEIPAVALKFEGQIELGAELYDIALFSKGLLMMSDNAMTDLAIKKGGDVLRAEGKELQNLRIQLHNQLTSSNLSELLKVSDTRSAIEKVEHSLVAKVNNLGEWEHKVNVSWRDIQKNLKERETAIEFLEYNPIWQTGTIVALILSKDSYSPIMRKVCKNDDLKYSENFSHCKTTAFYNEYWSNIESDLRNTKNIYFSPAGVLNTIPFEYCPIDTVNSLFDKYEMFRLTTTRQILDRGRTKTRITSAYLFGGIDYTPDLNEIKSANVSLINEGFVKDGTSGLRRDMKFDTTRYISNGIKNHPEWMRIYTATLSSTSLLCDFLGMMGCNVNFFNKYRATEECFKGMSTNPIDIVILNTHGFTFDSKKVNDMDYSFTYKSEINNVSKSELAMTMSGLLLSGASMAYSPTSDRENLEDGIITAAEIAQLNLKNVQLVHLSACETGLGEITAEGVIGLQRGFKRAGVKSIISTLAPAYTNVITYFDTTFYRNLFYEMNGKKKKKQSIHDAFMTTVKKVKALHKDTKYWCVNVLIDAID